MDRKQRIILAVLGIGGVVVWIRGLTIDPVRSKRSASVSATVVTLSPIDPATHVPTKSRHTDWGDNPFLIERKSAEAASSAGRREPVVSGVLWDPEAPSAVINNQVVMLGDKVDGWQVVEIQKDRVILSDGTIRKTIRVIH